MKEGLKSYHDKEIVGYYFDKAKRVLSIHIAEGETIVFENVVFFEFTEVAMQNVIFELRFFNSKAVSDELLETFPALAYYKTTPEEYQCYHVYPSVGLEAIIVCEE